MNTLDQKIQDQINNGFQIGSAEVFVDQNEWRSYMNLKPQGSSFMQKMYASVINGEVIGLHFSPRKAISAIINELESCDYEENESITNFKKAFNVNDNDDEDEGETK